MLSKLYSFGLQGLDAYLITIETFISRGLPSTTIVGLPDNAIRESKERVRSAIKNSGFNYPGDRITINLSPADVKKEGPAFDLAIALGILTASEQIPSELTDNMAILGELSLDGHVRSINGALSAAMACNKQKIQRMLLPKNNVAESMICDKLSLLGAVHLKQTISLLENPDETPKTVTPPQHHSQNMLDFHDVKGQYHVKRGLEIAAAGGHNCLMIGPPGSGKTMMAKRLPSILPDMTHDEALEVTKIQSIMGLVESGSGLVQQRPFRSPHHTSSDIALIGGGSNPRPGEVTLAHNGVLFLDELPEFKRSALEALRQPLEDNTVTIARANKTLKFPSSFLFIASMNPSPSGYDASKQTASPYDVAKMQKYLSKISGPLLDRIDLHIEVPALNTQHLMDAAPGEPSQNIKQRTIAARTVQTQRFNDNGVYCNAKMSRRDMERYCSLDKGCQQLLRQAVEELQLSARAHDKILKIARTIADLDEKKNIEEPHITEAISFRNLDRSWWR